MAGVEVPTTGLLLLPWFKADNPDFDWVQPTVGGEILVRKYRIPSWEVLELGRATVPVELVRAHRLGDGG